MHLSNQWEYTGYGYLSRSFQCDQCWTSFYTANGLALHVSITHTVNNEEVLFEESRPSPIPLTNDMETEVINSTSDHVTRTPSPVENKASIPRILIHCSACIEEFAFSNELTKHEATHGIGFACLGCGGSFKFKTNLDKHFEK